MRLFLEKFLMSQKGPPFEFFDILQQNICSKAQVSLLLHFSALCDIFGKEKIQKFRVFYLKKDVCAF